MSIKRKKHFVEELKAQLADVVATARQAEVAAAQTSNTILGDARNKEDAKGAAESGRLARAHRERRERAKQEIEKLIGFASTGLKPFRAGAKVGLGALIDVHIEDPDDPDASEERTLFILPVGAGNELTGPGGDGFISVVTPGSPVGRALQGAEVGDSFDLTIAGVEREWTVVDAC